MKTYYFGCWDGMSGHYLKDPSGKHIEWDQTPWGIKIDGKLSPTSTRDAGISELHTKDNWTALAFWDYSVDGRPGSNSIIFAEGIFKFDEMIQIGKDRFPAVMERFDFPIVELQEPDN
ncbi:hypothetical protein KAR91_56065 [Candidatus Pacearchaeota archaeon]|nr:hypothetical protein [Candidatus Pacearchaeota archaeon]